MCPRTSSPPPPTKKCWPCRRRRLKCDGNLPGCQKCEEYGVECTYTKPLTWVKGVASRGHMMNSTFGVGERRPARKDPTPASRSPNNLRQGSGPRSDPPPAPGCRSATGSSSGVFPEVSKPLTDPVFQDMGRHARFLVDYCKRSFQAHCQAAPHAYTRRSPDQRRVCPTMFFVNGAKNPYSQAISMMPSSPALTNAILAVAACHCAHGATGSPLVSFLNGRVQRLPSCSQAIFLANSSPGSSSSHSELLKQYLVLKHNSLRHLSEDLGDPNSSRRSETLATVLFLALLELMESGAGFWSVHIEGAKKLLEEGVSNGTRSGASLVKAMIDELIL